MIATYRRRDKIEKASAMCVAVVGYDDDDEEEEEEEEGEMMVVAKKEVVSN